MKQENKSTVILIIFAYCLGTGLGLSFHALTLIVMGLLLGVSLLLIWPRCSPVVRWQTSVVFGFILFGFISMHHTRVHLEREGKELSQKATNGTVLYGRVVVVRTNSVEIKSAHSSLRLRGYFRGRVEPYAWVQYVLSPKKLSKPSWSQPVKVSFVEFKVVKRSPFVWVFERRDRWTQQILDGMRPPLGAWFRLLLLGDEGMPMSPELQTTFKYLGIMHLMVVSGAQMGILTQMVLLITLRWALPVWLEALLLIAIQGLFAVMVGGGVSVWRSMLMSLIAYFALRTRRRLHGMRVLELTVLIMLLLYPSWMVSLGFWLSVLATAGLMELAPFLEAFMPRILAMMMGPLLLTAPIILLTFHRLDLLSLFANLLIVPLVEWIVVTGFAALAILTLLPMAAPIVLGFEEGLMAWVYQMVRFFKQINGMTLYTPYTPWPLIVGWFAGLFLLLRAPHLLTLNRKGVLAGVGVLLCLQVYQSVSTPTTWCFMAKQKGAWVVVANKQAQRIAVMNHEGQSLYQSVTGRYPFLASPQVCVVEDRWLLSHRQRTVRVGALTLLSVGDQKLTFSEYWPGLTVDVTKKKDVLWVGDQHWPASKGLVLVWKGRHIRRLNAREYFS